MRVTTLHLSPARLYMGKPVSETNNKSLAIFHSNIRRLRNKINYISDIIEDFDIVFFTETHLDYLIRNDLDHQGR
jgi:hypothetical protein